MVQYRSALEAFSASISSETPIPVQMEKFWGSESNKQLMQSYFCENMKVLAMKKKVPLVLSGTIKDDISLPPQYVDVDNESVENVEDLTLEIEEADLRIIPHIAWNIKRNINIKNFIVISRDTDVIVLLSFYFKQFSELGVMRVWIVIGIGEKKRFLPIHRLYSILGEDFCHILLKLHIGTGCDYLSKIGTKCNTLNADPVYHLSSFGENLENSLSSV